MKTTTFYKPLAILGLMLILLTALSAQTALASKSRASDRLEPTKGEAALSCRVGQRVRYDYNGVFQNDAQVESLQGTTSHSVVLSSNATMEVTALRMEKGACTYEVALSDVLLTEMVGGKEVEAMDERNIDKSMYSTFYFTQQQDGQIREILIKDDEKVAEVVAFKRGVINALNITLRNDKAYKVTESDNSGTYTALYEKVAETKGNIITLTREKDSSSYVAGAGQRAAQDGMITTQSATVNIDTSNGTIHSVAIDEFVVLDEPDSNDPSISESFWHDTITVRASINVTMQGSEFATNTDSALTRMERTELTRFSVAADTTTNGNYTVDNSDLIAALLTDLERDPSNRSAMTELVIAARADENSVAQLAQYLNGKQLATKMDEMIASALIGIGSADAQAIVQSRYLTGKVDATLQRNVLMGASTLQQPTAELADAVALLAANRNATNHETATLILGSFINKLASSDAKTANAHTALLERALRDNQGDASELLYMRALGNAGQNSSLNSLSRYLNSHDKVTRFVAVEAMRKIPSTQVETLLTAQMRVETDRSVLLAIAHTSITRAEEETNGTSSQVGNVILDESWERVFGNNTANGTLYANAFVDTDPLLVDFNAGLRVELFNREFDAVRAQLLTEKISDTERRFYLGISVFGNDIGSIDETVTCGISEQESLVNESYSFPSFTTTPPIPVGPLLIDFTVESGLEFDLSYFFLLSWCDVTSVDAELGLVPSIALQADGYATVTLGVLRGGVGVQGDLVKVGLPVYFTADMSFQNASELCFKIDVELDAIDMELYGWGQYWFINWRPDPRPNWTLWDFQLVDRTWNWYEYCSNDNGGGDDLNCIPNVNWWDGTTITPMYDGANCFVAYPPAGSTPFATPTAWYVEADSNCPAGMPWNGTGCVDATITSWSGIGVNLDVSNNALRLTFYRFNEFGPIPACPNGWSQSSFTGESRVCTTTPPSGVSIDDYFMTSESSSSYTIYVDGNGSCNEGILDATGCRLGSTPAGTNAFYYAPTNGYYYAQP